MEVIQSGIGELIQPPDLNAFRAWNRKKTKCLVDKRMTEKEAEAIWAWTVDHHFPGNWQDNALQILEQHKKKGDFLVLVSASPAPATFRFELTAHSAACEAVNG